MSSSNSTVQGLPPLFDSTPVLLAPKQSLAKFPINTFLENIVVDRDGYLLVTNHEEGKILKISGSGLISEYAAIDGKVSGLAIAPDGTLLVTGWTHDSICAIWQVYFDSSIHEQLTLRDALFLNGITLLEGDRYLIADSYRGVVWEYKLHENYAQIWLEHPLLSRRSIDSPIPAANGLKRFGDTLYVSNTDQMLLLTIPINTEGNAGEPVVWLENVNVDDFAFDTEGTLYGATHIYNSVIRITSDKQVSIIAQSEDGVTGSTAIAFGRTKSDRTSIYVVTNGGMFLPPPTGVVEAEIIRLEVNQEGYLFNHEYHI